MRSLMLLFILIAVFSLPVASDAQPVNEVRILHVDTRAFPNVKVHVRAYCGGQQSSNINQVKVRITENGQFRNLVSMTCPSQTEPVSVALVLDRSGSVAGTSIYRIKEGAWRFVELFQTHWSGQDEGAIFSFGDDVTMHTGMTNNLALLFDAISRIYPYGLTTMFDAIIEALNEVANNGNNQIKAVIVLSDGDDNNSIASLSDVITRAQQLMIPVFCIGLSYDLNTQGLDQLRQIADQTGGMFLEIKHPDDIIPAYNSMMSLVTNGANDCIMNYVSDCADGSRRELQIIAEACGLADTAVVTFTAPLDPNLPTVHVWFDSTAAFENGEMHVPVMIDAPAGTILNDLRIKILERPPIQYIGMITQGFLAETTQLLYGRVMDTVGIQLMAPLFIPGGPDTLLLVRYRTPKINKDTSFVYPAFFVDKKTTDCMPLKARTSNVSIHKRPSLEVACDDTVHVTWNYPDGKYDNGDVTVGVNVANRGSLPAKNTRVRIIVPWGTELLSPSDTYVVGGGELPVGSSEYASFNLRVLPVDTARTIAVCIEVVPDSGLPSICCTYITVERARPLLELECDMISRVEWSDSLNRYMPEVFPVRARVRNRSELDARNISAWIHVPEGFEVDSTTPVNTFVNPKTLTQSDTGWVTWMVRPLERPTSDLLTFCVKVAAGLDTAECCNLLYITASPVRVRMQCTDPIVITHDEGTGEYDPRVWFITTTVKNISTLNMTATRGHLQLPPFLRIGSSDFLSKDFPNGAVILPGDSATVTWVVELSGAPSATASICVRISAENFPGAQCCTPVDLFVENAIPSITCTLDGPDTVRYVNGGYEPQPVEFAVRVSNTGATPAMRVSAALLQGAELSIDPGDVALKLLKDSLAAGASVEGSFRVRILDRPVGRMDTVRVTVYAANGGGAICSKLVYIEAVSGPVLELACNGPDSLVFSDYLGKYEPEPFIVSVDVRNVGSASADSIVAELLPPPDMTLAAGEQPAKLLTPSTLNTGEYGNARWLVRATPRSSARMDTLAVQVRAKGKTLQQTAPCLVPVYVPAARTPNLELNCAVLRSAGSDDTVIVSATVRNNGTAVAFDIATRVEVPARLRLLPANQPFVQTIPSLQPGKEHSFTWRMVVTRGTTVDSAEVCFESSARFVSPVRCCLTIDIPPKDQQSFTASCALSVDTLRYDDMTGDYPEVVFSVELVNTSTVYLDSVFLSITLPTGVVLGPGEGLDKYYLQLGPSAATTIRWRLRVLKDTASVLRAAVIGVRIYGLGSFRVCEKVLVITPPPQASVSIGVGCAAPDTLYFLSASLGYRPAPFPVSLDIVNTGASSVSGIRASVALPPEIAPELGETLTKDVPGELRPGDKTTVVWLCRGLAQTSTKTVRVNFTASADGVTGRSCAQDIVLFHPPPVDSASMVLTCASPDTIHYDARTGTLQPSPFPVTVEITNNGNTTLTDVTINLHLPPNVVPAPGEGTFKPLGFDLPSGSSATVTFSCVASVAEEDLTANMLFTVTSAQTASVECATQTLIAGRVTAITLSIPDNLIGVIGRSFIIPLHIGNSAQAVVTEFDFTLRFDRSAIGIDAVQSAGTLTSDWILDVTDLPDGMRIVGQGGRSITGGGTLLELRATALERPGFDRHFDVSVLPVEYRTPLNFGPRIAVIWTDGAVTIAGDCVEPLKSMLVLEQNAPNPFNPSTRIEYSVDAAADGAYGVLEVLDAHGRRVRLLHEGALEAGTHSVTFDAGELPSGVYLARLRAGALVLTRKMLLAK
ncbi:MAG: VWA domain-containing protein [Bacteroidia bacterium]|nr:VWA domain-containing protein [Bacteroidia bacterium]